QLSAIMATRSIREVRVYSPNVAHRESLARQVSESSGIQTQAVGSTRAACAGAGIICTATTAQRPVLSAADVDDNSHINAVGSRRLTGRELDVDLMRRAWVVVDSRVDAPRECGDLLPLVERGDAAWELVPELAEVVSGVRRRPDAPVLSVFE